MIHVCFILYIYISVCVVLLEYWHSKSQWLIIIVSIQLPFEVAFTIFRHAKMGRCSVAHVFFLCLG